MKILTLVALGAIIALAGCTQPDGMPDFGNPEDPDNLIVLDDEGDFATLAWLGTAMFAFGLAVVLLHSDRPGPAVYSGTVAP